MVTYSIILQGSEATEENALNFAQGFDFSECEEEEFNFNNSRYINSVNGIDIYYNYAADYYFFTSDCLNASLPTEEGFEERNAFLSINY